MPYYGDLTNTIQAFIYTHAQFLKKHEQRILITIILLHSERLDRFTTAQRHHVTIKYCRDLVPVISRLTQKLQETPTTKAPNSTCVLYDELFDYFEPETSKEEHSSGEMEEVD